MVAKILDFRLSSPRVITDEQSTHQLLSPKQAIDEIITGLVGHILPIWIENQWPFKALEIMSEELRSAMSLNVPSSVSRHQVLTIIEELKPIWHQIAKAAYHIF